MGFEWTGSYQNEEGRDSGGHRTVIFEDLAPCADYWIGAGIRTEIKDIWGVEGYTRREEFVLTPHSLIVAHELADSECGPTRRLSWFHHPALYPPRPVDWSLGINRLGDRLVEIHSEHGSSECWDPFQDGCEWRINGERFTSKGSVQVALQHGYQLGFVGATDNHEARPGSVRNGAGPIASNYDENGDGLVDPSHQMHSAGAVSGVLFAGDTVSRSALFDGLEARNTVAASFMVDSLRVAAIGQDGVVYLPGDAVPADASPLHLMLELEDDRIDLWTVQLLDPWNDLHARVEEPQLDMDMDMAPGEVRYIRVRAWNGGIEHRIWISPFFGIE